MIFDSISNCKTPEIAEQEFFRIFRGLATQNCDASVRASNMREFLGFTRGFFIGKGWEMNKTTCQFAMNIIVAML